MVAVTSGSNARRDCDRKYRAKLRKAKVNGWSLQEKSFREYLLIL